MKNILLVSLLFVVGLAYSEPVKSMLGSDGCEIAGESVDYPTDYITDGIVSLWDGIDNVGFGVHDEDSRIWVDCIEGNEIELTSTRASFDDNSFYVNARRLSIFSGACFPFFDSMLEQSFGSGVFTVEISRYVESSYQASFEDIRLTDDDGTTLLAESTSGMKEGSDASWVNIYPGYTFLSRNTLEYRSATIALVVDGNKVKCYANGVYKTTKTLSGPIAPTKILIGMAESNIYSIRIYGRLLTAAEVNYNYLVDCERFGL